MFKPAAIPLEELEIVTLGNDELECLHLCDGKGMSQIEAGDAMGISRGTEQRLLTSARAKVATALVEKKGLAVACSGSCDKEQTCCKEVVL